MDCRTIIDEQGIHLCPILNAAIHAGLIVGAEGILLFDRNSRKFFYTKILSRTIQDSIGERDFSEVLENNNDFKIQDISNTDIWKQASSPFSSRLSMNICLSEPKKLYVNFQATPINLDEGPIRVLMCSLRFSARKECNIIFSDRQNNRFWRYDFNQKTFLEIESYSFSEIQLDMLRLSRIGYSIGDISKTLHRSRDTIKLYRKQVYEQLGVSSIEEAISLSEIHHLI